MLGRLCAGPGFRPLLVQCSEEVPGPLLQVRPVEDHSWVSGPRLPAPDLSSCPGRHSATGESGGVRPPCGHVSAQPHSCLCPTGLPGFCVVRRVPGGLVVGRSVPHPLRTHPDPPGAPTAQEAPSSQAAVAPAGRADPLERQSWRLRLGLACGDHSSGQSGRAAFRPRARGRCCPGKQAGDQEALWVDSSSFCQGKYTSAVFCLKPPPPSVCTVLLTLAFPSPHSEPRQAQETLGLVSLLYGLETTPTVILLPNEGQSRDFGIRTGWAFSFTSMLPDHQPHSSVLRQEKKN